MRMIGDMMRAGVQLILIAVIFAYVMSAVSEAHRGASERMGFCPTCHQQE